MRLRAVDELSRRLNAPIDNAFLAFFRVVFGAMMVWEVLHFFRGDFVNSLYVEPSFYFKYYGFEWVEVLPEPWMTTLFVVMGLSAVAIVFGAFYRVATATFFLCFTYVFLLDQTHYLNHFYFICLLAFLLVFLPADRRLSFDAYRRPELEARTAPAWTLWLLRFQMSIVYFYGGIAKINADWLRGEPLTTWLDQRAQRGVVAEFFGQPEVGLAMSWGGMLFDLLIVFALLWRRTRVPAFALAVAFHCTNAYLFEIGIFPWLSLAATMLFFAPDARLFRWFVGDADRPAQEISPRASVSPPRARVVTLALAAWISWQIAFPLRHFLYPSNVHWSEEGHRFAWHMKLRHKTASASFFATRASGETVPVDPATYLTPMQIHEMSSRPDMILQFAHHVADALAHDGERVEVRALVSASLNRRPRQLLIDPEVDLAAQERSLRTAAWIVPLRSDPGRL